MLNRTKNAAASAAMESGPQAASAEPSARAGLKGMSFEEGQAALEPQANVAKKVEVALETLFNLAADAEKGELAPARIKTLERTLKFLSKADLSALSEDDKGMARADLKTIASALLGGGRDDGGPRVQRVRDLIDVVLGRLR